MDIDQADKLVEETHGLYVAIKKKLFNGQLLKQPEWVSKLDSSIQKTCLLLGQWTECEGDIAVVEDLSGITYTEFIDKLTPYCKGEDPFIHLVNRRGTKTYYLSSVENTWEYIQVSVTEEIWNKFVDLFLDVINEHERIFTYGQRELIRARFTGEKLFWSANIRKGMLKTLLIKAGYKRHEECQDNLNQIVEKILSCVDNADKWKYISGFFIELCEIAPGVVLKRILRELEESTGLMFLFENQDSDFIMGKNHYINILFGVDEFLVQREFATDAFIWLLKLDNRCFEYKSNNPADAFNKVLCAWHNFSVFRKSTEKIALAEMAFEHDDNAWDIIYKSLPGSNQTIMGVFHAPLYRNCVQDETVTYEELNKTAVGYIEILLNHADFNSGRWVQLIKCSEDVDGEIRRKILEKFLCEATQMTDSEKIAVKNSIRQLIYRHRYFSSASWAMSEEEVKIYEDILNEINCTEIEYEYLYLFNSMHESPLLYPVPYSEEDKGELNEAAVARLLSDKIAEFKNENCNLELLAELCANMDNSSLGRALATYWNGTNFDINVFTILLRKQKSAEMALDYYAGFGIQTTELFDEVMEVAQSLGLNNDVITGIYRVQALYCATIPKVAEAEEDIKYNFWKYKWVHVGQNEKWALKECKKYGALNSYLRLLYFTYHTHTIPNDELYEYFDEIEKMEYSRNGGDFRHYIEELLKPLQDAYMEDSIRCTRIAIIEMIFSRYLRWENMKCFKQSINKDPRVYADLVNNIFKKDHGTISKYSEEENEYISNLYSLYHKAEFCPCEFCGEIKEDELELWVNKFKYILEKNDQESLFGMLLGRLFAFAPNGRDGHMPCEAVRTMIEKYSDDSMREKYRSTVYNSRGVFSPSAGKEEFKMAEKFKVNAEYM